MRSKTQQWISKWIDFHLNKSQNVDKLHCSTHRRYLRWDDKLFYRYCSQHQLSHNLWQKKAKSIKYAITVVSSSCNTWSYSDIATQNIIAVTSSKQWIHFFLSDRWPPTSNNLLKKKRRKKMKNSYKIKIWIVHEMNTQ